MREFDKERYLSMHRVYDSMGTNASKMENDGKISSVALYKFEYPMDITKPVEFDFYEITIDKTETRIATVCQILFFEKVIKEKKASRAQSITKIVNNLKLIWVRLLLLLLSLPVTVQNVEEMKLKMTDIKTNTRACDSLAVDPLASFALQDTTETRLDVVTVESVLEEMHWELPDLTDSDSDV